MHSLEQIDYFESFLAGVEYANPDLNLLTQYDELKEAFDEWWKKKREDYDITYELHLPVRVINALKRNDIKTVGQVRQALERMYDGFGYEDVLLQDIRGIGLKSINDIREALALWDQEHDS